MGGHREGDAGHPRGGLIATRQHYLPTFYQKDLTVPDTPKGPTPLNSKSLDERLEDEAEAETWAHPRSD